MSYEPPDDDHFENNPYSDLDTQEREWKTMLESDPETFWRYLVRLFSEMDSSELEIQQEAFEKAHLQSQEIVSRVPDDESELAVSDIHEMLLIFKSASDEASKHMDD